MTYRIRYREPHGRADREVTVEAASPTEAMVKFKATWDGAPWDGMRQVVTSVRADEDYADFGV